MNKRAVSQQQIARELGFSQALVSLVLNGRRENISGESYRLIWNYAVKHGYRPKGMRAHGAPLATASVGFVLRAGLRLYTQSNFFSHVEHGLHETLTGRGYNTVFLGAEDHLAGPALRNKFKRDNLFGIVILGEVAGEFLQSVRALHRNIVTVSASYPGLCHSVMSNERQAAELLVQHLTGLGHRRFGWVGGNKLLRQNALRRRALEEALAMHGLKLPANQAVDVVGGDRMAGRRAAESILKQCPPRSLPTAWVCHNGLMSRGVANYFSQKGWAIPDRFSVVAIDATRICEEEHPQITGASASPEKMGSKAAEILLQAAGQADGSLCEVVLASQLTVRESSGPAA